VARVDDKRYRWCDEHGLVHRMEDDKASEREAPYTLLMSCNAAERFMSGERAKTDIELGHAVSNEIRKQDLQDPVTCFQCLAIESRWIAR
jgi:hypothetical protein